MDHVIVKLALCLLTHFGVIKSQLIALNQCTCPGHVVSFQCTVVGNGNTVYTVTGCPDQLTLLSTGFNGSTARRQCPQNGAINAYGVRATLHNMTFVSQLNITPSQNYEVVTVECYREVNNQLRLVDSKTFSVGPAPPTNVYVKFKSPLTFAWSEVPNHCGPSMSVQYEISAIDCGSCPRRVSDTYAICSGARTVDNCTFTLKAVIICGSIIGLSSTKPVYVNDSATTTVIPTTSTVTSAMDEGSWETFRQIVVGILIVLLVLLIILLIIMLTTIGIIIIRAQPFFETIICKQFGRRAPAQLQLHNVTAMNQEQEHGLEQQILDNLQNIKQHMSKDDEMKKLRYQLEQFMILKDGSSNVKNYHEAKAVAKATPSKDTTLYSRSLEHHNNGVPPEPTGADGNFNLLERSNNNDVPLTGAE